MNKFKIMLKALFLTSIFAVSALVAVQGCAPTTGGSVSYPNAAQAAYERGEAANKNSDYDLAIREYTEAIRLDPNNDRYYFSRALKYYYNKKDYDRAIADYTEAIRISPNWVRIGSRGDVYLEKGDYNRAIADYTEAIRLDPNSSTYYSRGKGYLEKGDYANAIADLETSLQLKPDAKYVQDKLAEARRKAGYGGSYTSGGSSNPSAAKAAFERGKAARDNKDHDLAIREFTEAIRLDPNGDYSYYFNRGLIYYWPKKDYDKAIADYTEAIRLHSNFYLNYSNRGNCYLEKGDYTKAIADYEAALQLKPSDYMLKGIQDKLGEARQKAGYSSRDFANDPKAAAKMAFASGKAAADNKDYDLAISEYTEAIRLDPNGDDNYYFYRAQTYKWPKKDYDKAIADYTEAIRISPSYVKYYCRGDSYLEKGEYANAIADYEASLQLKPDDSSVKDKLANARQKAGYGGNSYTGGGSDPSAAKAAYERGEAANKNNDYDLAIREYTEAIRLDPNGNDNYYFSRAIKYEYNKKDYDRAIADYTEAIRIKPSYVTYRCRGDVYLEKGDYARAIADYEASLRINPDYSSAKDGLAKARQKSGSGGSSYTSGGGSSQPAKPAAAPAPQVVVNHNPITVTVTHNFLPIGNLTARIDHAGMIHFINATKATITARVTMSNGIIRNFTVLPFGQITNATFVGSGIGLTRLEIANVSVPPTGKKR